MMDWIRANWVELVAIVGGVVLVARIIVKLTPTPKDDTVLEKIVNFLKAIGLQLKD